MYLSWTAEYVVKIWAQTKFTSKVIAILVIYRPEQQWKLYSFR